MLGEQGALFENPHRKVGEGPIEYAAKATISALMETGTLDKSHSLKVELILAGARALDGEMLREKVTVAATTLFSRVVDIADGLPTVQQAINDQFERLTKALANAE